MSLRAAIAAAALCAISLPLAPPAAARDDLVIGVAQFPSSLHPAIDAEVIKSYVVHFAIRPVTAFNPEWKNSCLLCATLPTVENGLAKIEDKPGGGQGMAVTLTLRPDLKWGDGTPVTTKDLEFTWKVGRDPASGWSNPDPWDRAASIDIKDDRTAVLHLDRVMVSYNQWNDLLPAHIEGPVVEKATNAADYLRQTTYDRAPTTPGLWNGPFLITQDQSGNQVVLEPNPQWSGTKPGFKRIVIRLIDKTPALLANLLSGDIDMVAGEGIGLTIDQVIQLQKRQPDRFTYIFKPSLTYEHIDLKIENPALADIRVRHALLHAIDRKTIVRRLFEGKQPVADTWVNPLDPDYTADVAKYPYDPARARALLAEAGWKPGRRRHLPQRQRRAAVSGNATTAGNQLRELVEQVLQNQWKASCVEVTIKNEPPRTLFGETLKQRQFHRAGHVRLDERGDRKAAADAAFRPDPDRREQLGRRQLHRLQQQADGHPDRPGRDRAGRRRRRRCCGRRCRRSTPTNCRCCRCISAPSRTSSRNGWPATCRPGMATSPRCGRKTGTRVGHET